jgi:hypothetical protein
MSRYFMSSRQISLKVTEVAAARATVEVATVATEVAARVARKATEVGREATAEAATVATSKWRLGS